MKRDNLNLEKRHASVIKTTFLTVLLVGCMGAVADDSRTPMVRLNKLAITNNCEQASLQSFASRIDNLFADFFDISNTQSFKQHKADFVCALDDLDWFLKTAKLDKATHKEITHMIKELNAFIATLEGKAQPIFKKGAQASYSDIMPLAIPLRPYAYLIPDKYFQSLSGLLNALLHRLRCQDSCDQPAAKRQKIS